MKALRKDRVIWVNNGIMPYFVGFCPSEKAWDYQMGIVGVKVAYPTSVGCCSSFTDSKNKLIILITLSDSVDKRPPSEVAGLVSHESTHAFQRLCEKIGEDSPSSEFEAYTIQSIVDEVFEAYVRTRRREWSKL